MKDITSQYMLLRESISCRTCQKDTERSRAYLLDKRLFCGYKCAFRFVWRIIYGWVVVFDGKTDILKGGWDDSLIQQHCLMFMPKKFEKQDFNRKEWSFALAKFYMTEAADQ